MNVVVVASTCISILRQVCGYLVVFSQYIFRNFYPYQYTIENNLDFDVTVHISSISAVIQDFRLNFGLNNALCWNRELGVELRLVPRNGMAIFNINRNSKATLHLFGTTLEITGVVPLHVSLGMPQMYQAVCYNTPIGPGTFKFDAIPAVDIVPPEDELRRIYLFMRPEMQEAMRNEQENFTNDVRGSLLVEYGDVGREAEVRALLDRHPGYFRTVTIGKRLRNISLANLHFITPELLFADRTNIIFLTPQQLELIERFVTEAKNIVNSSNAKCGPRKGRVKELLLANQELTGLFVQDILTTLETNKRGAVDDFTSRRLFFLSDLPQVLDEAINAVND